MPRQKQLPTSLDQCTDIQPEPPSLIDIRRHHRIHIRFKKSTGISHAQSRTVTLEPLSRQFPSAENDIVEIAGIVKNGTGGETWFALEQSVDGGAVECYGYQERDGWEQARIDEIAVTDSTS
jgi:hypothetical protein